MRIGRRVGLTPRLANDSEGDVSMHNASSPSRRRRVAGLAASAILAVFGVAAIAQGLNGQSTVRDALALEGVTGAPHMTPAGIAANAKKAGLKGIDPRGGH